jgi:hypothetical protein
VPEKNWTPNQKRASLLEKIQIAVLLKSAAGACENAARREAAKFGAGAILSQHTGPAFG